MDKEFGKDSFEILWITLHNTNEDALAYEEQYLLNVDVGYNPMYLNRHNGAKNFTTVGTHHTEEWKQNNSKILKGIKRSKEFSENLSKSGSGEDHPLYGTHQTEEQNKIQSEKLKGRFIGELSPSFGKIHTKEQNKNHSEKMSGERNPMYGKTGESSSNYGNRGEKNKCSKKYIIIFPDGHEEIIIGLNQFCKEYNLDVGNMIKIAKNKPHCHTSKGFKCRYYTEEDII
jgi:hypothetical protein